MRYLTPAMEILQGKLDGGRQALATRQVRVLPRFQIVEGNAFEIGDGIAVIPGEGDGAVADFVPGEHGVASRVAAVTHILNRRTMPA